MNEGYLVSCRLSYCQAVELEYEFMDWRQKHGLEPTSKQTRMFDRMEGIAHRVIGGGLPPFLTLHTEDYILLPEAERV